MRFILVDRIHELEPGKQIVASKTLPSGEELFRDHFPGFPVVPGVLLTEMMAQAAGKCLDAAGDHPGRAILVKINSANFRSWVRPDEEAMLHAEIVQNRRAFATASCFVEVNSNRVCTAELFFVFLSDQHLAAGYRDEVLGAYLATHPASAAPANGN